MGITLRLPGVDRLKAALPNTCAVCRTSTRGAAGRVCTDCRDRFAAPVTRCRVCALRVPDAASVCGACLQHPPPWSRAVAACDYSYPWDGLLQDFKFRQALDLAPALTQLLHTALQRLGPPSADLLLPVPLSRQRLRERGYNQALVIARALGRQLNRPCPAACLLRLVDTPHQLELPREARQANMRGAFAVEPLALSPLRNRHVALVDDVMTTGATAGEAARVLLQAGAASVQVWTVARTPP